jgi:hypothetical protein
MTTKAEFNAEEWEQVVRTPALAALTVIAAQRGGSLRESLAAGKAYTEAREEHESDLIGEIAATPPSLKPGEFSSKEDLRMGALERVREAVALLESKATLEEVDAYKQFTLSVAQRAAEADKSGGVLGIGGERVSDAEREALRELAEALGTEPPA